MKKTPRTQSVKSTKPEGRIMRRIAIRNRTEGRIALNKLNLILVPYKENRYIYMEVDERGLSDSELIGLHQANLIEVIDADQLPQPTAIQPTAPQGPTPEANKAPRDLLQWAWGIIANAGGGNWKTQSPEWQEAAAKWRDAYHNSPTATTAIPSAPVTTPDSTVNDASNSEVTVMTPEGPKKGRMKYSITGEAQQAMALPNAPEPSLLDLNKY